MLSTKSKRFNLFAFSVHIFQLAESHWLACIAYLPTDKFEDLFALSTELLSVFGRLMGNGGDGYVFFFPVLPISA